LGYAPLTHLLLSVYILQYRVAAGSLSPDDAAERVAKVSAYVDIDGFAKIDHQRGARTGLPEVVFGQGKATHHIVQIMQVLAREVDVALVTRVGPDVYDALVAAKLSHLTHYETARMVALCRRPGEPRPRTKIGGRVVVCAAGTADLPVAEEAAVTAELMGIEEVTRVWDIGMPPSPCFMCAP
jgi:NCAIR mutase (PurE)-related protein